MVQEQLVRKVKQIGNGAHVFVPREWVNEEVKLSKIPKKPVEERILDALNPHLKHIKGIFLFGSYARNEQNENSDIDVLVIAEKPLKIKEKGFEIIVLKEDSIEKAIEISPMLIYSALKEAKTIMNKPLLEKIKEENKINKIHLKNYIKETKRMAKANEELLDSYSIILRLKGIFIIKQLLSNKKYSHKEFNKWIKKNLPKLKIESLTRSKAPKLNEKYLSYLLEFLKQETNKLEKNLNG